MGSMGRERMSGSRNSGQRVCYWREEPHEVDAILEGSWGRWAVEVTTGVLSSRAVRGLAEFTRRFPSFRPLLLTEATRMEEAGRTGFEVIPWTQFLLDGPLQRRR